MKIRVGTVSRVNSSVGKGDNDVPPLRLEPRTSPMRVRSALEKKVGDYCGENASMYKI